MSDDAPSPHALWMQAEEEYPDNRVERRSRFLRLMRLHGHIVFAESGEDRNLPCGWPGLPPADPSVAVSHASHKPSAWPVSLYPCDECGVTFQRLQALNAHRRFRHSPPSLPSKRPTWMAPSCLTLIVRAGAVE